jgi:hypothetical protein
VRIHLDVNLRDGSHHTGNWGGVLANPATILANAIATLVDGKGRLLLEQLKPPRISNQIRATLADVKIEPMSDEPALSENWGEEGLSAAERLYAWNTLEVLAMSSGNIEKPANAILGRAHAVLQLRFVVGTRADKVVDAVRSHLQRNGFPMVEVRAAQSFAASRTDFDSPWINWTAESIRQTTGKSAGGSAEFRRLAAQRRVFRLPWPAHDLGAAFLSGLLPARARRTHPVAGHRGGPWHHGGFVLGFGRDAPAAALRGRPFPPSGGRSAAESYILFRRDLCKH